MSLHSARRLLARVFPAVVVLLAVAWLRKGALIERPGLDPHLASEPTQAAVDREAFQFTYKRKLCRVRPVASYDLWGLVVSHNNIHSIADIYHDSTSVDTKDLCVIWGDNLTSDDYRQVDYWSGPWTCYWRYPAGVRFDRTAISNNHLVTDDPAIRALIDKVRVGDQIHLRGLLVDYQMEDWEGFWRRTSTVRSDSGCEVIFVERLEILHRGTPGWYSLYRLAWLLLAALPVAYLALVWLEAGRPGSSLGRLD